MAKFPSRLQPLSDAWEWQRYGRCRDRSGVQFFHPEDDPGRISRRLREIAAKQICQECPVRPQCATHALVIGEEYGIWGGFSENERQLLQEKGWRAAVTRRGVVDPTVLDRWLVDFRARYQRRSTAPGVHGST